MLFVKLFWIKTIFLSVAFAVQCKTFKLIVVILFPDDILERISKLLIFT